MTSPFATAQQARIYDSIIDDRITLPGNTPPAIRGHLPLGPADHAQPMDRMILALRMAPESRRALDQLLRDQQDPASPRYHRWLNPEEFAAAFAPAPQDVARVTDWLKSSGFRIDDVARGGLSIVFSGDVERVQRAFRTPIQRFLVDGRERHANALDPSIPRDLAGIVQGVVSIHDLPRQSASRVKGTLYTAGTGHWLAPADFATIYDLAPLHALGIDGTGQSVAIVGRANPGLGDVTDFRAFYGLPPGKTRIVLNGPDPGKVNANESVEANLDMQWAGATAPGADILFVCSGSTATSDGVDLSSRYAVDNNLAPVMSVSFGSCENTMGEAETLFYTNTWAQAAAQGITVCVASGDAGAAGCNMGSDTAGYAEGVSGLASTPSNVCVGGTMFADASGTYWSDRNSPTGGSALSYIPEAAWNESATMPQGSGLWATGGGSSLVHIKPWWQTAPGVPADDARAVPDVAFSAAGHDGYLVRTGGKLIVVGGTSASSPAFAGMVALLVQKSGQRQGNLNPLLYSLASLQGQGGVPVFHDIVTGDNSVPNIPGYAAGAGYDRATGLGSLDGAALVGTQAGIALAPALQTTIQKVGASYTQTYTAGGGTAPYTWSLALGPLPPGLSLSSTGTLSGVLQAEGAYTFTLKATDARGASGGVSGFIQVGPVNVTTSQDGSGQLAGRAADYSASVVGAVDTSVRWSSTGGTLTPTPGGISFKADAPGLYRVTATSNASPGKTCSMDIHVHDADFVNGHAGKALTGLDALYLAGMTGLRYAPVDLTGDCLIDEADVTTVLDALGW